MKPEHTWIVCSMCGPAVRCDTCGNNCCNGGSGTVDGETCPDCDSAYEKQSKEYPPEAQ